MNLIARGLITAAGTPQASGKALVMISGKATVIVAFSLCVVDSQRSPMGYNVRPVLTGCTD